MADRFGVLKGADQETLFPVGTQERNYPEGTILVVTQNMLTLPSGGWASGAIWTHGTWTQYGTMAQTANTWRAKISVPTNETWILKLSTTAASVQVTSSNNWWACVGIVELTGANVTIKNMLGYDMAKCDRAAKWLNLHYETVQEFQSGDHYFCPIVLTSQASGNTYHAKASTTTAPTDGNAYNLGPACTMVIQLVERKKNV